MADRDPIEFRRPRTGRHSRRWTRAGDYRARPRSLTPLMVVLPLAAFAAVFWWGGPPLAFGFAAPAPAPDRETAQFARCGSGPRIDCVVDGDTFWFRGAKIRVADINTPEVSEPACAAEARLGARATARLQALLNAGPFTLAPNDDGTGRDRDKYGRLLRTVTRGGESLGQVLVREGLAEEWKGYRSSWC